MGDALKDVVGVFDAKSRKVEALLGKGPEMTAEDLSEVKSLNDDLESLSGQIEDLQQLGEIEVKNRQRMSFLQRPSNGAPFTGQAHIDGFSSAGAAFVDRKSGLITDEGEMLMDRKTLAAICSRPYKEAFQTYLRKGLSSMGSVEVKMLQEGADTAGGFLVPEEMLSRIVQKEPTPTRVYGYTTKLSTSRDAVVIPKVNYGADDLYTTGIRTVWTGEVPATATTARVTDPVFGAERIPVYTAMMSMPITNDMVEDAAFPLVGWAAGKFAETIELLYDNMILTGTGIGQPTGILNNPGAANQPAIVPSGNASAITADGLVDLAFSLPEQYDAHARFVMNKTSTAAQIALLKDTTNRYLWGYGLEDNGLSPDLHNRRLLGYDVSYSGFMPGVAANSYPVLFGDFTGYYLVNRVGFSIQVLRELYAETNQILLLGRLRFGGQVAEDWKIKVQQVAV